jgi:signal transduction histidine kinase
VSYRGEHVGALCLPGGEERRLAPDRRALLADLTGSVGVILHNASLSIQLEHRLREVEARAAEIRASRLRIVAAQDSERRELERDLHDGAQPGLTAVRLSLGLASHMGKVGNIGGARRALDELPGHITEALARLRQTLRGLDPQIFSLRGLGEALREQAEALDARPVFRIGSEGPRPEVPLDPVVASAVYFCCTEALQNTVKHCPGAPVEIRAGLDPGVLRLRFSISDQGPGFDAETIEGGRGLPNMADRIGAVGGAVEVSSRRGRGTRVTGWVPVTLDQAPATVDGEYATLDGEHGTVAREPVAPGGTGPGANPAG